MDNKEFEKLVADYVEGKCSEALRQKMDQKRRQDPACERMARVHKDVLMALKETPKVSAPPGLSERILLEIRHKEKQIAEEQKFFHRYIFSALPMAAFIIAAVWGIYYSLNVSLSSMANLVANWFKTEAGKLAAYIFQSLFSNDHIFMKWFDIEDGYFGLANGQIINWSTIIVKALNQPVQLPIFSSALPVFYLVTAAAFAGVFWYHRDELTLISY